MPLRPTAEGHLGIPLFSTKLIQEDNNTGERHVRPENRTERSVKRKGFTIETCNRVPRSSLTHHGLLLANLGLESVLSAEWQVYFILQKLEKRFSDHCSLQITYAPSNRSRRLFLFSFTPSLSPEQTASFFLSLSLFFLVWFTH